MPRKKDNEIYSYKLKNGKTKYGFKTYVGIDKETGKSIKVTRQGYSTRKEAEKAKIKIKADGPKSTVVKRATEFNSKTVSEVYNIWLPIYRRDVRPSSVVSTKSIWENTVKPEFGDDYINHLDVDHLQKFVNDISAEYVNYKRRVNLLQRLIRYAIIRGWANTDPFAKVIIPKKGKKSDRDTAHNFYELDELKKFLSAAKKYNFKYYTYFMILASLGLRRGEGLGLKWKDIDFEKKKISIRRSTTYTEDSYKGIGDTKTPTSKRDLMLPDNLIEVLKEYRSQEFNFKSDDDYLFHTHKGDYLPPTAPTYWIGAIYAKNPDFKQITLHGLRHSLATLLYEDDNINITPKDVQTVLGHKDPTLALEVYTHVTQNRKSKITKTINNMNL